MSPDGLAGGLYSSLFVATGVEGLLVGSPPPDLRTIRWVHVWLVVCSCGPCPPWLLVLCCMAGSLAGFGERCAADETLEAQASAFQDDRSRFLPICLCRRQQVPGSPRSSQGALLEGPGHPLLPARSAAGAAGSAAGSVDSRRVSSLQEELGAGEGVTALLLRSSTAGEGGGPGVVQTSEEAPLAGASARSSIDGSAAAAAAAAPQLLSPPSSPRRRQTTFGATLDFVETLCQASSSLTAFQRAC